MSALASEKTKHHLDLELEVPLSVEACSERLEAFSDGDPALEGEVDLLPVDGVWRVSLTHTNGSRLQPDYAQVHFKGAMSRSDDGTLLTGQFRLDPGTYLTRGVYLALLGPVLIFLFVRVGIRVPLLGLFLLVALAFLLYLLVWQPDKILEQRREAMSNRIRNLLHLN